MAPDAADDRRVEPERAERRPDRSGASQPRLPRACSHAQARRHPAPAGFARLVLRPSEGRHRTAREDLDPTESGSRRKPGGRRAFALDADLGLRQRPSQRHRPAFA